MKRIFTVLLALTLICSLAACGSNETDTPAASESESAQTESAKTSEPESTPSSEPESEAAQVTDSNTLVVYFSMPETTNPDESSMTEEERNSTVIIDGEVLGNTQYVAYVIQENTGADLFRIEPEVPYPTDHDTLVDQAAEEQDNGARPAIKDTIENFDQYDTIFVGYPKMEQGYICV